MRGWVLPIFLLASTVYTGSLNGTVSSAKFDFAHTSDWQGDEIINRVRNNHATDPLVVFWQEGGILAPVERPIPPNRSDLNVYSCPEESLYKNLHAELLYGLSSVRKTAGVYTLKQTRVGPQVLRSQIVAATNEQPFRLEVISISGELKSMQYVFVQNRHFHFALPLPSASLAYFEKAGWKLSRQVSGRLKYGELPLKERIPDFQSYTLLDPPQLKTVVNLPLSTSQVRSPLLIITDEGMNVVASGFISLHLP